MNPTDKTYSYHSCSSTQEVLDAVRNIFRQYAYILPQDKLAKILIKPNLNSDAIALTGNTTDLRLMAAVLAELKDQGYANITVGEGTSSGFFRNKINVAQRLRVTSLVKSFEGVKFLDFNYDNPYPVRFEQGVVANVSRTCVEADFFINLPKIKTHFETQMSACLKSLIGCLVGLPEKQKAHSSLFKNIICLNKYIRPDLTIVDGLISMEGTGPSLGTPLKTDLLLAGRNPFLLDLLCTKLMGLDPREVPVLVEADRAGYFSTEDFKVLEAFTPQRVYQFKKPSPEFLSRMINNQRWQKYFIRARMSSLGRVFDSPVGGKLLNFIGLRQDVLRMEDAQITAVAVNGQKCTQCQVCEKFCPLGLKLESIGNRKKGCISCLYCFFVCPEKAIEVKGEFGFLEEQVERYGSFIQQIGGESMDLATYPKVSIIIPTYNSARTLEQVIVSCQNQTYGQVEIIVVDNSSQDETVKLAEELGAAVYKKGPERSAQRNFGARAAQGNYYIFLDSDISISPRLVEECVSLAKQKGAEVITFKEFILGEGFWAECRKIEAQCFFGNDKIEASRFFSKSAFWSVGGFDTNLTSYEDWDLRERVLEQGYKIFRTDSPTFHNEGKINLKDRIQSKGYYAQWMGRYASKHKNKVKDLVFRDCYLQNWRLLIRYPIHTAGFLFMKALEGVFVLYTLGRLEKVDRKEVYK